MFGVLAGIAGGVAIAALYAALAVGRMGLVRRSPRSSARAFPSSSA
ncbi:MAG: hypothetical protein GIX03_14655 [Candidatus Eremiobacteraeota bacterium]|nr:hypothetical protein [Candidatus Eremiobacteraeota bacterium]MBC5804207.1 hypothetical protein [Candidatus Eremiobacteraeota bacterium]MBC5822593.1 hypothetical protein [Candidatus Eremiobacteraeota bacterium]